MPVVELGQRMSAYEEAAWVQFYQLDPFGDYRADVRSAQIAQILYSANSAKGSKRKTLTDFMPFFRKRVKPQENVAENVRSLFGNIIKQQSK